MIRNADLGSEPVPDWTLNMPEMARLVDPASDVVELRRYAREIAAAQQELNGIDLDDAAPPASFSAEWREPLR